MTSLVGIYCKDGVVIGADGAATLGSGNVQTIEQKTQKIDIVDKNVIVAGTGQVGLAQRFTNVIEKSWKNKLFQKEPIEVGKNLCRLGIADFTETGVQKGQYASLVAFPCHRKHHLCEFDINTFQPELKNDRLWYVSLGSGMQITDPFLGLIRRVFWSEGPPTHQEAIFAVTWALHHAIDVNPGGVNSPIQIAVLSLNANKYEARLLDDSELQEHMQSVSDAEAYLRDYRKGSTGEGVEIPKVD